jgi:hypothetical protein
MTRNGAMCIYIKVKQSHYGLDRPRGFQEVEAPRFPRQSAHEGGKFVSPTHRRPLPQGNIPGTHFCYRLSRPQGHTAAGRIMSLKNSKDNIENRTRDPPACSAVRQPTAPPRSTYIRIQASLFTNNFIIFEFSATTLGYKT